MTMPDIGRDVLEKELRELVSKIVEIDAKKIGLDTKFVEDLGMDSMMALEILAAMEKKYKIQVPEEKLNQLRTLKDAVKLTEEYL